MAKWIHAYWLVILVSCLISISVSQAITYWAYKNERERGARERREGIVRGLLGDLRVHCEYLQSVLLNPTIDIEHWQNVNDELQARIRHKAFEHALGERYNPLLWALAAEARAIVTQRKTNGDVPATLENVADVLVAYAPFIRAFGDARSAREFDHAARKSYDYAKTLR
jgi:hypothetical protein